MSNDRKRDKRGGKPQRDGVSRRRFLGQASCAAVGTTALFSTVLDMSMFNALAQTTPGDYKALVCLFFGGGIDSFNMVVPTGQSEYDEYAQVRRDLALPQNTLLPINPTTPDGRQYGVHPNMPELQTLFEQGDLAFMANVGTLVEPTNLQQYRSRSVRLPLGLFSHSDQATHWQTSLPDQRTSVGWAGRMADILYGMNSNPNISMNISLAGNNVFQSGMNTFHYSISQNGSRGLRGYDGTSLNDMVRTEAIDGLLGLTYQNLFERTFANRMRGAIDADVDFRAAIDSLPPLQTQFSDTGLSQRFRMVAQTIQARNILGFRRQTFFISMGGWDHHDEVLLNQQNMLPVVSAALSEFQAAMVELQTENDVTTFTASEYRKSSSSKPDTGQRATLWGKSVRRSFTLYSLSIRCWSTSNCNCPIAPMIGADEPAPCSKKS